MEPHEIVFVPLADLDDATLLGLSLAGALQIGVAPEQASLDVVVARLNRAPHLLLLQGAKGTLPLVDSVLQAGDAVEVAWHDLLDAKGQTLQGKTSLTAP